jgi:hypothetical protein
MDNLIPNPCAFASQLEIRFSPAAVLVSAVSHPGTRKCVLMLTGSLLLSGCLSLRLGKNEAPRQAPSRTEIVYIDSGAIARR